MKKSILLLFICLCVQAVQAQVSISYPHFRQVFQRNNVNEATFSVLGNYAGNIDHVQAKLVPVQANQGQTLDWFTLDEKPKGGVFQGNIVAKGGWYQLKIRTVLNQQIKDSTSLGRVGVGENFIISGQSNAEGTFRKPNDTQAIDDRVIAANFYNFFKEYNPSPNNKYIGEHNLDFPMTEFRKIDSTVTIGPMGLSNFYWPILGDSLVKKYNVPVCFYNTAWVGTGIKNWAESSRGVLTANQWAPSIYYPKGFPYANLRRAVEIYGQKNGVRAILWHQGENDAFHKTPAAEYKNYFIELINTLRRHTGMDVPWLISEATSVSVQLSDGTCTPTIWDAGIVQAQKDMVTSSGIPFLYSGPNTENVEIPRKSDCIHFSRGAYVTLADLWFQKISSQLDAIKFPISSKAMPNIQLACGPNNELSLDLTTNFKKITWYNTSSGNVGNLLKKQLLTSGQYSAILEDDLGNQFSMPSLAFKSLPLPSKPTILVMGDSLFCEGQSVELKMQAGAGLIYSWSNGIQGNSIVVKNSGLYQVKAHDADACSSEYSNKVQVQSLPVPTATIEVFGSYMLKATSTNMDSNMGYSWEKNGSLLAEKSGLLRLKSSGKYSLQIAKKYSNSLTCLSPKVEYDYTLPDDGGLSVFPNPAIDNISIESIATLAGAEYYLYTIDGRVALQGKISQDGVYSMNLSGIHSGKYQLVLKSEGLVFTKGVVIVK
ncbi:T9SS type A sorting domain-containing protein [Aquirufa ecclesiirivi]|uniref:T9SS type A sorting domain-containing protein n=1 Tax=Aquirufa ecclesiirivi TaxID=2715124 RepID=A0ABT4JJ19_9BACT|nr:sialate O-acetylesterase [Aquirufa ecclesiirivi]MCZ2476274.1 T9SS type A sorting domain-containing protein [Aquirufa ecclesiirivi]